MKTITFTIPKGGVGKTLLEANVAAALATSGKKVVVLDADPSRAMETILSTKPGKISLSDIVNTSQNVNKAVYPTGVSNLSIIPSGLSLDSYFDLGPLKLAKKLENIDCDILFIDTPFPMSESAFLALGISNYLIMILTEDEFSLCVETGIDLSRLARHVFDCVPAGFIVNRITGDKITDKLVSLVEKALQAPCITKIQEDPTVRKSYGGPHKKDAYLYYTRDPDSDFSKHINEISKFVANLPEREAKPVSLLENIIKQVKR